MWYDDFFVCSFSVARDLLLFIYIFGFPLYSAITLFCKKVYRLVGSCTLFCSYRLLLCYTDVLSVLFLCFKICFLFSNRIFLLNVVCSNLESVCRLFGLILHLCLFLSLYYLVGWMIWLFLFWLDSLLLGVNARFAGKILPVIVIW